MATGSKAITGYISRAGTLILTDPVQGVPQTSLRDEAFIFFTYSSLFNRVQKNRLAVMREGRQVVAHHHYTARLAMGDFNTLAREIR